MRQLDSHHPKYDRPVQQRRRLKGFLALIPETASWYPYQRHRDALTTPREHCSTMTNSIYTKKITSRKQHRRFLKRYQQNAMCGTDLEQGFRGGDCDKETIYVAEHIDDMDVAVIFMFDPYQPYSIHLLQKLISVCHLSDTASSSELSSAPLDKDVNAKTDNAQESNSADGATASPISHNYAITTDSLATANTIALGTVTPKTSQLHCIVVTPCNDMVILDQLLQNSGFLLMPWTEDHSAWRIATGTHVCPAIVGVYECQSGRNLFPIQQEELALDWNTSIHVQNAWLHQRASAFTWIQRIQAYALHPTASNCNIQ